MAVLLATFLSTVRGVRFYDVSVSSVRAGGRLALQLEPTNVLVLKQKSLGQALLVSDFVDDLNGYLRHI